MIIKNPNWLVEILYYRTGYTKKKKNYHLLKDITKEFDQISN